MIREIASVQQGLVILKLVDCKYYFKDSLSSVYSRDSESKRLLGLDNILEVSTASPSNVGNSFSAFNLMYKGISLESYYQSTKILLHGLDPDYVRTLSPSDAKGYVKAKNDLLLGFQLPSGETCKIDEADYIYNWLYINSALENVFIDNAINNYNFADIFFNPIKGLVCQARSLALLSVLIRTNKLDKAMRSFNDFKEVTKDKIRR